MALFRGLFVERSVSLDTNTGKIEVLARDGDNSHMIGVAEAQASATEKIRATRIVGRALLSDGRVEVGKLFKKLKCWSWRRWLFRWEQGIRPSDFIAWAKR